MRDHETLLAWQRARALVLAVFRITRSLWKPELAAAIDQLRRSSLSIQLNVAEGHALSSSGLFRRHLTVAYGSAVEAVDVIGVLKDLVPDRLHDLNSLEHEGRRCCALVLALKHSIERRRVPAEKPD